MRHFRSQPWTDNPRYRQTSGLDLRPNHIIARELGIPCVNGVPKAAEILNDGDLVTVDGHLGIVTVGAAEFDLEFGISKITETCSY